MAQEPIMSINSNRKAALAKAILFVAFIVSALATIRLTPLKGLFTVDALNGYLDAAGLWAPAVYVLVFIVGVCLLVPYVVLAAVGAGLFGAYRGFVYVWLGALLGAGAAFLIARGFGRDFVAHLIGDRLRKYDDGIEKHGFTTVLYLRLVYFPFVPMNFAMGLTKVRFWDYFVATGLGIALESFIFTFTVDALKQIWLTSQWGQLLSGRMLIAVSLFVFSLFIPKMLKMIRK
jgi:uncharacterized membrane protein YdjX (TVP38/TMEM64 family)